MLRSLRTRARGTIVVLVACALALPASASAAGGGSPLHIDPASPVAKAYALPLDIGRGASPGSVRPPELFGAGIKPAASRLGRESVRPTAYRTLEAGSGSGLAWMAIPAVVVLALGSAGAFALSRRR